MTKKPLTGAGAVLLRGTGDQTRVLVVHRPRYKDWSLPKGTPKADEPLPAAAVREVREETGYLARLGFPLGQVRYRVGSRPKQVFWWAGRISGEPGEIVDSEVDKVAWWDIEQAERRLSYPLDVDVLHRALAAPPTVALLIVRHGKAMSRKHWSGKDADRRLTDRGRRQVKALIPLLDAYGVSLLASSSSTRCVSTLSPYAQQTGLIIEALDSLSEEGAKSHPDRVLRSMDRLRIAVVETGRSLAVCGHRPVLPQMVERLGVEHRPMAPAATLVVHLDQTGTARQIERLAPRF